MTVTPSLFDAEPTTRTVGPVLVGNGGAICLRCTVSSLDGDDHDAWAAWHARQGCDNYTGHKGTA